MIYVGLHSFLEIQLLPSVPVVKFDIFGNFRLLKIDNFLIRRTTLASAVSFQDYYEETNCTRVVIKLRTSLGGFATKCLYQEEKRLASRVARDRCREKSSC